jgi:hypothetical protein
MRLVKFTCDNCGEERERPNGIKPCHNNTCCDCCKKEGLQSEKCKLACLELDLLSQGKELNQNEMKGIFLERAMSNTLKRLEVSHKHNPFKLYYSNYQCKNPDIIIEALNGIIECKNINKKQVNLLSSQWLDENVINRPNTSKYNLKMALFSYKPRQNLVNYLKSHDWRTYGLGFQILNSKQEKKAMPRLKQQFWWLRKAYDQKQESIKREQ